MHNDVFLSYSSRDTDTADKILAYLESRGLKCWIAHRDISPGANYGEVLMQNLSASKIVVLVLSQHSNASQQVMREIERAVNKRITIIPFRIDDVQLSDALEYFISACQWLDARKQTGEDILDRLYGIVHQTIKTNLSGESIDVKKLSNYGNTGKPTISRRYIILSLSFILVLVGGFLIKKYYFTPLSPHSLVLLPFEHLETAPPLKSNIKEELVERLDRYEPLTVYSVDTLQNDGNGQIDLDKTIGSINVRFIITGKCRNLGDTLRYTVNILDRSVSPPQEIWTTTFESGLSVKQSKLNAVSRQINQCIMLESSKYKDMLTPSTFQLYRAGQIWLADDSPNSLQEAEASFRAMLQSDSTISVAYSSLAQVLFYQFQESWKQGLLSEVKTLAHKSIVIDSLNADGYSFSAMASFYLGENPNQLVQPLKHAIDIDPDNVPAISMLGIIYWNNQDINKSKYYFLRAKQLDPGIPINYTNLGGAYYYSGNLNETYTTLTDGLKLDSTDCITWRTLGCYYERKELFDDALHAFKTALKYGDDDLPARDNIAGIQILRGDLKEADSILQEGIRSNPQLFQLKYTQGVIRHIQKKYNEAKSIWKSGLESARQSAGKDSSAEGFKYLGLFSGRLGDNQGAVMSGQRAVNLDSTNSDILAGMARIYSMFGNTEQMKYWLGRAKKQAVDIDEAYLKTMPDFLPYISDPEILAIVRK